MRFDKKTEFSKPGTVELSDDALEGVSGGTTLTYDPNYKPPEHLTIKVEKPPTTLGDIPCVGVESDGTLTFSNQTNSNKQETQLTPELITEIIQYGNENNPFNQG